VAEDAITVHSRQTQRESIAPNEPASRSALIRRAYFDLIGIPPTPEQLDAFVNDRSPDAFAKAIDQLLNRLIMANGGPFLAYIGAMR